MKKIISLLCALTLIGSAAIMPIPVNADCISIKEVNSYSEEFYSEWPDREADHKHVTENGFTFDVYDGYAYLTDYDDTYVTEITIPEKINDVDVVGVYDSPFGSCHKLESITLPDTLKYFTWIDLVIPFSRLGSNEEAVPTVKEVKVSETNPYFIVSDGILFSKDMKTLVGCPPALEYNLSKLPKETETIGLYSFIGNTELITADIPDTVKTVMLDAFRGCMNLKSVTLPESVTEIQADTFSFCPSLSEVNIKGDITGIGTGAFAECTELKEITIPSSVKYIGYCAFENAGCIENDDNVYYVGNWCVGGDTNRLTKVSLREDTVGIAEMSFILANRITEFTIPSTVKNMGTLAYQASRGDLATISFSGSKLNEGNISGVKKLKDIYIYDKNCDIEDSEKTIPAKWKYAVDTTDYEARIKAAEQKGNDNHSSSNSTASSVQKAINTSIVELDEDGHVIPESSPYEDTPVITADETDTDIFIIGTPNSETGDKDSDNNNEGDTVIHGYAGSTAEAYANKYNRKFELIEDDEMHIYVPEKNIKLEKARIMKIDETDEKLEISIKGFEKPFVIMKDSKTGHGIAEHPLYVGDIVSGVLKIASDTNTVSGIDINADSLGGDVNCDDSVDLSDAVLIMQALANPDKYGENGSDETHLTAGGRTNADIEGDEDGMTNRDALSIQKRLLHLK